MISFGILRNLIKLLQCHVGLNDVTVVTPQVKPNAGFRLHTEKTAPLIHLTVPRISKMFRQII